MSTMTYLTIEFKQIIMPKQILRAFVDNGFNYVYEGEVLYLEPESLRDELFDWQSCPAESFDIETFIERLKPDDPTAMSLGKDEFYASIYIYPDKIMINVLFPDDIPFLEEWDFQDFSWCLNKLVFLTDLIEPESIECLVSK